MGEDTNIEWCDHTFNPWMGCTKVSTGCDRCYAETFADKRFGLVEWGGPPRRTSAAKWREPWEWNRAAEREGVRRRVFCASLADVFDNQVPEDWRRDLFGLIDATPWLDWLILTKRPQNIARMMPAEWGIYQNVWLGVSVENQTEAKRRIPILQKIPAVLRFLSCEPLLGPINLRRLLDSIDWVIVGAESGKGARPMQQGWVRSIRDQCHTHQPRVEFFYKQDAKRGKKISLPTLDGVQHIAWPEVKS